MMPTTRGQTTTPTPTVTAASEGRSPEARGAEGPATVLMQPMPIDMSVAHKSCGAVEMTAIMRTWRDGDAARCQLCPRAACTVNDNNACIVLIPRHIPYRSAALATLLPGRNN
jgi:hypothetical protein